MRQAVALVLCATLLSGCAFHKATMISSEPSGAKLRIGGEVLGNTPVSTKLGCSTFGGKPIEISKDGFRTLSATMDYKWSGRNVTWSVLLFWPGILIVGKCPKPDYAFQLEPQTAELSGQSTLTISELSSDGEVFVGDEKMVAGQRVAFSPGWHDIEVTVDGQRVPAGEIQMTPDTDYHIGLEIRSSGR